MTALAVEYFIALGGPECLFALLERKCFDPGANENSSLACRL
jgi:hypothetical protein